MGPTSGLLSSGSFPDGVAAILTGAVDLQGAGDGMVRVQQFLPNSKVKNKILQGIPPFEKKFIQ